MIMSWWIPREDTDREADDSSDSSENSFFDGGETENDYSKTVFATGVDCATKID